MIPGCLCQLRGCDNWKNGSRFEHFTNNSRLVLETAQTGFKLVTVLGYNCRPRATIDKDLKGDFLGNREGFIIHGRSNDKFVFSQRIEKDDTSNMFYLVSTT